MTCFGYGVSVRNIAVDKQNTVARQQLEEIGHAGNTVIDIVRNTDANRPELVRLLDTVKKNDRIDLYSVDTLCQGNTANAMAYYCRIVISGIKVLIYDFSGAVCRYSRFSTCDFAGEPTFTTDNEKGRMIEAFSAYLDRYKSEQRTIGAMRREERINLSETFKEIYFAYESYQLDLPTTLELLRKYCGINNKITFWRFAKDYERSYAYPTEFGIFADDTPEILDLPKRCGEVPDEYFEVRTFIEKSDFKGMNERQKVELAMAELRMMPNYGIYRRWDALFNKVPKPRKPLSLGFSLDEFCKRCENALGYYH